MTVSASSGPIAARIAAWHAHDQTYPFDVDGYIDSAEWATWSRPLTEIERDLASMVPTSRDDALALAEFVADWPFDDGLDSAALANIASYLRGAA
ncbi:hypothetical protein [Prosthecomicrobium pneumaticum]|uniref:CdiI immunity protein domain-containing protein n=1 Tax=Prosthecomicrobium pneumaticum TaxID=81895 RepID=A0A7W9FPX3_9HYPH|nr:hypothetical protein [Prosthecomicrobium pneumaticum]MBB5754637.1 hypothetical protein [Prosthecomicrobium pneumaticum]